MILFFNVKITDIRKSHMYRPPWFVLDNRMDVFKYSLSSYEPAKHLFDKIIIYAEIDENYQHRTEELKNFIDKIFDGRAIFRNSRCGYLNEWRNFCDEWLHDDDEIIWHCGQDDHIFIDYNLEVMISGIDAIRNDPDSNAFYFYSHWPESMRIANHYNGILQKDKNTVKINSFINCDSVSALKSGRFKNYWFNSDLSSRIGNDLVPRTDELAHYGHSTIGTAYYPTRELVRHYDGYSHVGNMLNYAPPVYIPPGFFENNIKILAGSNDRIDGYTTINSDSDYLYAAHQGGSDYRWLISDIPLFWKDKITDLNLVRKENPENRNRYYIETSKIKLDHPYYHSMGVDFNKYPPETWFVNHLK